MTERADSTHAPAIHLNGATYPALPKPRRKPIRIGRQRRDRIEAAVDGLLRLLDEVDGDPDDEDGGDFEPTTGPSYADECEMEDPEPSLGWTHGVDQSHPRWHRQPPNTGQDAWAVPRRRTRTRRPRG